MKRNVSIIGAGAWGCALANYLINYKKSEVYLYPARKSTYDYIREFRTHPKLKDLTLKEEVKIKKEFDSCITNSRYIVIAVSSKFVRSTLLKISHLIRDQIIISVCKGLEPKTLKTSSEIIEEITNNKKICVLSGPSLASEIERKLPAVLVAASEDQDIQNEVKTLFESKQIKLKTSNRPKDVEIVASLKNIVAIASGYSEGCKYGENFKAALMTDVINELYRYCQNIKVSEEVFWGGAGLGDVIATASSNESRNYQFGFFLASDLKENEIKDRIGMSIEGINILEILTHSIRNKIEEFPLIYNLWKLVNRELTAFDFRAKYFEI